MEKINKLIRPSKNGSVYLLGIRNKHKVFLRQASWDCGWYWGFGYIKEPNSHSHWSSLVGKQEYYDIDKSCWRLSTNYIYHLNENPEFTHTVLTDRESWDLAELMESFYALRNIAEVFNRGGSHITTNPIKDIIKNSKEVDRINKIVLPELFKEVYKILTPIKK